MEDSLTLLTGMIGAGLFFSGIVMLIVANTYDLRRSYLDLMYIFLLVGGVLLIFSSVMDSRKSYVLDRPSTSTDNLER
jgi:hypothetical protein